MLLTGTFPRSVDEKQRIAIPKRVRDSLNLGESTELFIGPGTDGSLALYTKEGLEAFAHRLQAASPAQQDVRAFHRVFYAQIEQVDLDSQGRIRIPPGLAQLAGLTHEAVLIGVQDHLELWDKERWEQYLGNRREHFDQLAEKAFGQASPPTSS
jgi:MraZ protein